MVRPQVHSEKHIVQFSIATVTAGAVLTLACVAAVPIQDKNIVSEVREGSTVKAIYIELWERSSSTTTSSGQACFFKKSSDATNPNATDMAALGNWDNKKNILYTTMGLFNDADADAQVIYKGWLKIPKGKQRFGLNDQFNISLFVPTVDTVICGLAIYKEYF